MPITTTPSGGPQGEFSTYTPIYATTISSNTSAITLSNIPTTFTDLVLVISVISTSNLGNYIHLQYNGDTGSNYSTTILSGTGSGAVSQRFSNRTNFNIDYYATPNTTVGTRIVQIQNYSNTTTFKTGLLRADRSAGTDNAGGTDATVGLWRSTAPITSITITHDTAQFAPGSTITLYGIKAAAPAPKATGGDVITTDGTYWYHAFKTTGVFSLTSSVSSLTADVLQIAGGGGGGSNRGGGGGAGGLRIFTSQALTLSNYVIAVGAGGSGGGGTSGNASQFHDFTVSPAVYEEVLISVKTPESTITPSDEFPIADCAKPTTGNVPIVAAFAFAIVGFVENPVIYTGSPFAIDTPLTLRISRV